MATKILGAKRRASAHREPADEHAATELVMFIENTSDLSPDGPRGQGRDVLLNALRKWRKGTYDPKLAVKLFGYLAESGAKRYAKEFGSSEREWSTMFNPATRQEAAKQLEASFRNSAERGEYDHVDTRTGAGPRGHLPNESRRERRFEILSKDGRTISHITAADADAAADEVARLIRSGHFPKGAHVKGGPFTRTPSEARRRKRPPERPAARADRERKHSMTYGTMPSFEEFERDIHTRIDPEGDGKRPYWPPGTTFPMELVGAHEQELAYNYGLEPFQSERQRTGRNSRAQGFRGNESDIYNFVVFLIEEWNNGDEEAGDLASSIMYTLGYEWL